MQTIRAIANDQRVNKVVSTLSAYNPMEMDRYHTRFNEEVFLVKSLVKRVQRAVESMESILQPLFPTFSLCTLKESREVLSMVKERLKEYRNPTYMDNANRILFAKFYVNDMSQDMHVLLCALQCTLLDLKIFDVLVKQAHHLSKEKLAEIDSTCKRLKYD